MRSIGGTIFIAAAIVRRGNEVLLVRQQGPDDPAASWALPGGVVEPGELLLGALAREVWEETGLTILDPGPLVLVAHSQNLALQVTSSGEIPQPGFESVACTFETQEWRGDVAVQDPDRLVSDVRFFPLADAIGLLGRLPFRAMREPAMAYLRREVRTGSVWLYRKEVDGTETLITRTCGTRTR